MERKWNHVERRNILEQARLSKDTENKMSM